MKALSIRQPWAYHILYDGKDIENRSWATKFRGTILIHAGKKPDFPVLHWPECVSVPDAHMGGIVGMVDIVDCVTESDSRWFEGKFGFVLRNPRPLPFLPMNGQLGFFEATHPEAQVLQETV